jgi:hypothetical protein
MGGKVFKGVGKALKKVAPIAAGAAGMYFGGPAGGALAGSLFGGGGGGGGGGNDIYGGIGQVGGGLYNYYNNRTVDKGILEAQLKAGEQASQLLNPYYQTGTQANQRLSDRLMGGFNINQADELARQQYNSGLAANPQLTDRTLKGFQFNQGDLYNDPGYQFAVEQGQRRLNSQAAAGGLLGSGRALKEATQYGQGMAEGQFNNVYNRNFNTWNQENQNLSNLVNQGSNAYQGSFNRFGAENAALQNLAGQGQTAGTRMGNLMLDMGKNRADYRASRGEERLNLTGNLIGGAAPILGGIGDYLTNFGNEQQSGGMAKSRNNPLYDMGGGAFLPGRASFAKSADMPLRTGARRPMTGFGRQNAAQNMRLSKGMRGSNWKVIG